MAFEKPEFPEQDKTIPDEDIIHHQPEWFRNAIAAPKEQRELEVNGAKVNYFRWGNEDPNRPGILFVHGNGAHAQWFSFIAPLLTHSYNVASMDLPGMGDSGWTEKNTRESFATAVGEVALAAGLGPRPVVVGHSFGGFITHITSKLYGDRLGGVVLCDFRVCPPENAMEWFREERKFFDTTIVYPDFEKALARFRLAPLQPCANGFIIDYIGRLSIRQIVKGENPGRRPSQEEGFTWKFDPLSYRGLVMGDDHGEIWKTMACKGAAIYGLESRDYDPQTIAYMRATAPEKPIIMIANAQHHIMLDQPHAFASAVHAIVAGWEAEGALR